MMLFDLAIFDFPLSHIATRPTQFYLRNYSNQWKLRRNIWTWSRIVSACRCWWKQRIWSVQFQMSLSRLRQHWKTSFSSNGLKETCRTARTWSTNGPSAQLSPVAQSLRSRLEAVLHEDDYFHIWWSVLIMTHLVSQLEVSTGLATISYNLIA